MEPFRNQLIKTNKGSSPRKVENRMTGVEGEKGKKRNGGFSFWKGAAEIRRNPTTEPQIKENPPFWNREIKGGLRKIRDEPCRTDDASRPLKARKIFFDDERRKETELPPQRKDNEQDSKKEAAKIEK
jgi:hypothetical protein